MSDRNRIYVYFDHDKESPERLGVISVQSTRGKEFFSFEFDKEWLRKHPAQILDPDLQFYAGPQFTAKSNFGIFMDSAPDRWGRKLILRREALRARKAGEQPRVLQESDFLLGVYDETRMGALRFKTEEEGCFLNNDGNLAAPPWARLRELEEACRRLDDDREPSEHEKWLNMLIAPGSSLGGARPKATIAVPDGSLWIAKFPSRDDHSNVSAWEYAVMQMARECGMNVPECKLEKFSKYGSTFLTKRFDRQGKKRIHFSSAMTLLGKTDGGDSQEGSSYLELAEFIMRYGAEPERDLRELWRRIVFSIAVSNTDDHLRNHGFLLSNAGWRLSPAYDINPNSQGYGLSLNISESDNALDFSLARQVAPDFRLSIREAESILKKTTGTVSRWKTYANAVGIPRSEQETMQTAFRY